MWFSGNRFPAPRTATCILSRAPLLSANQKIYPHLLSDHQPISSKLFYCSCASRPIAVNLHSQFSSCLTRAFISYFKRANFAFKVSMSNYTKVLWLHCQQKSLSFQDNRQALISRLKAQDQNKRSASRSPAGRVNTGKNRFHTNTFCCSNPRGRLHGSTRRPGWVYCAWFQWNGRRTAHRIPTRDHHWSDYLHCVRYRWEQNGHPRQHWL